jgi:parallel beta-helix repeat protein
MAFIALLTFCLTVDPVSADTIGWVWNPGDCGGSPGAFLDAKTLNTEPGATVCVTPPSYQLNASVKVYVGVYVNNMYFGETSVEGDIPHCTTVNTSSTIVRSSTICTVLSPRYNGSIDFTPKQPIICECSSCGECSTKLSDSNCDIVQLTTDIMDYDGGTCIDNPDNFFNKVFDCKGYTIDQDGSSYGFGIYLYGKSGNIIKNCVINEFDTGIVLYYYSNGNTIDSNEISGGGTGIEITDFSNANTIGNSMISSNFDGIVFKWNADQNQFIGNQILDNIRYGVWFWPESGESNYLRSNVICSYRGTDIYDQTYDYYGGGNNGDHNNCDRVGGWADDSVEWGCEFSCPVPECGCIGQSTGTIFRCGDPITENCVMDCDLTTVEGCFKVDSDNITVDCAGRSITGYDNANNQAGIHMEGSKGTIENCSISGFNSGIWVGGSSDNRVHSNTLTSNQIGIYVSFALIGGVLSYPTNNTLENNISTGNVDGIHLSNASLNTLIENRTDSNTNTGINLYSNTTRDNTVERNIANGNKYGIHLSGNPNNNTIRDNTTESNTESGIHLVYGGENTIVGNLSRSNRYGLNIYLNPEGEGNIIADNNLSSNNTAGIYLSGPASGNQIFNNLFNNIINARFGSTPSLNLWNTEKTLLTPETNIVGGPYLGGNYWAKPDGSGFSENCSDLDLDGLCDDSYVLATDNIDQLPLTVLPFPNTPAGEDVTVSDETTGVIINFDIVNDPGITAVLVAEDGPEPPPGFSITSIPPAYYEITTTATYGDGIEIGLPYDESIVSGNEADLVLMHWSGTEWEDITIQVDVESDMIYGYTQSLSPFAVMEQLPTGMEATVEIAPDTLNLKSRGKWVTAYIELPENHSVGDIDIPSILLNDAVPAEESPTKIGDYDEDGLADLMVKFNRSEVQELLEPGSDIVIKVAGKLVDSTSFVGTDTINVIGMK